MEVEDDGVVEEDERHKKNPDMWREQHQKMKIMLQRLEKKHGFKATHIYSRPIFGFASNLTQQQITHLQAIPSAHVEENQPLKLAAPIWIDQTIGGQANSWGIYATGADRSSAHSGANYQVKDLSRTRLYVLDSGVAPLADLNLVKRLSASVDGNIYDCNGHGTDVAQIAAARNNTTGVAGVAPGAQIISIKVTEGCDVGLATSSLIRAIQIAVNNEVATFRDSLYPAGLGAGVINLSFESVGIAPTADNVVFKNALLVAATQTVYKQNYFWGTLTINTKGIFSAVAAGNSGIDACGVWSSVVGRDVAGVVSVGAMDNEGNRAIFNPTQASNFGPCVEVWAPGKSIQSTFFVGTTPQPSANGTSAAAPFVAGIALLISDYYPSLLPANMEALIKSNVKITSNYCAYYSCAIDGIGRGSVNVPQANNY